MKKIELPKTGCNDIDELFKYWKVAHEKDKYWKDTFPKCPCCGAMPPEKFKGSFTYDGYLTDNKDIKLLFIGRESNVSERIVNSGETDDTFWMRKVWNGKSGKYYNYLKEIRENLDCEYDKCAYMNINKRGGYSQCDFARLNNYVTVYGKFIKKEIELIRPKIVVFLGVGKYVYREKLEAIIREIDEGIKCYEVYHPSAPGKESKLKEKLKNEIDIKK